MTARRLGLLLGPIVFVLIAAVPSPLHRIEGLGHRPAFAAAVAALMAVWWFTEALPMWVTACAPLVLYPALGVFGRPLAGELAAAAGPYADGYIFLFMGGMAIGAAMEEWGLHRRMALHVMRRVGSSPRRLLLGMLVATAAVSLWISNTATAVMMLPIAIALVQRLEAWRGERLPRFGASLMLAVAYAANVGGMGTKIGTGTNSIFAGFVQARLGYDLTFLGYLAIGLPLVVLLLPVVWWVLWRHGRGDGVIADVGREVLDEELREMGPLSRRERHVAIVFTVAATLWVFGDPLRRALGWQGKHFEAAVAMTAALALALAGLLPLRALRRVPWSTLVLLGGSFAMAEGIGGSGLSAWLARELRALEALPLSAQVALATAASVLISALASNTATVNLLLNVLPRGLPVLAAATLGASCDFALPAGTPPNAIIFGSGRVRLPVMMRIGIVLDVLAVAIIAIYGAIWLPRVLP